MICHIKVFGRVQGVGFRAFTVRCAKTSDIVGWVRNRMEGSVEIYAEAPAEKMTVFLEQIKKGPMFGYVDRIETVQRPDANLLPVKESCFFQAPTC